MFINNSKVFLKSIIGTMGILTLFINSSFFYIPISIISIITLIGLLYLNKNSCVSKKEYLFSIIFGVFLSTLFVLGHDLDYTSNIIWSYKTPLRIFLLIFAFSPCISFLITKINSFSIQKTSLIDKKLYISTFFIIFFLNLITYLAVFPGIYGYDAGFQILEILDKNVDLTSHFSLFFSFLLATIVNWSSTYLNSNEFALAIFIFLQWIFMNYVATRLTIFSYKYTNNKRIFKLSILFFSLFPLYTTMIFSTAQDTLFSGFFALLIINLIEQNTKPEKKSIAIKIFILSFLFCISRNNGYYAILILLFLQLFNSKQKLLKVLPIACCLLCYKLYNGPFYTYLNVKNESPIKEMSSIPSQQLARVYVYNSKVLSKNDLKKYNKFYFRMDDFKQYKERQSISDPIKSVLDIKNVQNDKIGYLRFWAEIGLKDPKNYIEAFLMNNLGVWYPNKKFNDSRMYHPYIEYNMLDAKRWNKKYIVINRKSILPLYNEILSLLVAHCGWRLLPIISLIFETGSYFVIFCFTLGLAILRRNKTTLYPLLFIAALYLTIMLSPVALFRYSFPIVILLPIFITLIINSKHSGV